TVEITVNEVNVAPVLSGVPATVTTDEGQPVSFTASASDDDVPVQTLTFSLSGAPAGATIGASSGVFSWTPSEIQGPGVYTFDVMVSDGLVSTSQTIEITVNEANLAPVLSGVPATVTTDEGQAVSFTASATDDDVPVQTLTFSLSGAPAGATIGTSSGVFSWT